MEVKNRSIDFSHVLNKKSALPEYQEFEYSDNKSFECDNMKPIKDPYYDELKKNYVALKMEKMRVRTKYVNELQELQRKSRDLDRHYKSDLAKLKLKIIPQLSKMYEVDKLEGLVKKPNDENNRWELADEVREFIFTYCDDALCGYPYCNHGFINKNLLTYEEY